MNGQTANDPDSIVDQLSEVRTRLESTPDDDFEARVELHTGYSSRRQPQGAAARTTNSRSSPVPARSNLAVLKESDCGRSAGRSVDPGRTAEPGRG